MAVNKKLEVKVTVITGGTTGIGLAAPRLFVKEGAYVFITGRRQKERGPRQSQLALTGEVQRLRDNRAGCG